MRLVTGDRRPPLVMDDPFVTLDDERAKRALELLHDISTDFQVIYLTTSERYDETADSVVEPAPATALTPDLDPAEVEPAPTSTERPRAGRATAIEPAARAAAATAPSSGRHRPPSAAPTPAARSRRPAPPPPPPPPPP